MYADYPAVKARLEEDLVAWMTTVSAEGTPQPSLVWFVPDDDVIVVYSRDDTARLRNIAANPRVSLHFNSDTDGDSPIVIEGDAEIIGRKPRFDADPAYFTKYQAHLDRWGFTIESYAEGYPVRVHIRPTRLRAK